MVKGIRNTFFILSFVAAFTYIVTSSVSAQEKTGAISTKESVTTEKNIDYVLYPNHKSESSLMVDGTDTEGVR